MNANVPFLDIRAAYLELEADINAAIRRVVESGWYLLGAELQAFETAYARYTGAKHCIGVANGLDALCLSLRALGVGAGDEVIVPSNTYIATWLAVTMVGAVPVPVEPDETTYNLNPELLGAAITRRTKVILPVHLYGTPADLAAILEIAKRHGLRVLDDAAQAQGARYAGAPIGSYCDVSAWSFYPAKNLGAFGDAGAVTTNDDDLADRIRVLRNYGSRLKYVNEVRGVNSRLDEIQAAVLLVKLSHLDEWNARRRRLAARYAEGLDKLPLILPMEPGNSESCWHLYVVRSAERDALRDAMGAAGIDTLIHYPIPPHRQRAYEDLGFSRDAFPIATRIHDQVLSLPIGPHMTYGQQDRVIDALSRFFAKSGAGT